MMFRSVRRLWSIKLPISRYWWLLTELHVWMPDERQNGNASRISAADVCHILLQIRGLTGDTESMKIIWKTKHFMDAEGQLTSSQAFSFHSTIPDRSEKYSKIWTMCENSIIRTS
jgi:hypothetical protein